MARNIKKDLEEQLLIAKTNLEKAEEDVKAYKSKISKIENLIEEREKEKVYLLLKQYGISYEKLQKLIFHSHSLDKKNKNTA